MVLVRALLPGFVLTFLIAAVLWGAGTRGGVLAVQQAPLLDYHFFWSWPLFLILTALSWVLMAMMR